MSLPSSGASGRPNSNNMSPLPYLQKETDRHGNMRCYVRRRPNPRIRIKGEYGSAEFMAAYRAALSRAKGQAKKADKAGLKWLIEQYRKSSVWLNLAMSTRRQRENIFLHVLKAAGDKPYSAISRKVIIASRDARAATPAQAKNFLKAMSGLFKWAIDAEYIEANPVLGVKAPKPKNSGGFAAWTEAEIDQYQRRWPTGTKERVWLDVLLYTGLRRGDAVRIGRQHIKSGIAVLRTEKSGFTIEVNLPILPVLQKTLEAGPTGNLAFICGASRQPLTKESFGNLFRKACNAAGVRKSAHGLRKIAATRAAEAGATVAQLKALFGWTDDAMASLYTRSADRKKLALSAITMLEKRNSS